jgi:DNA repair protein RecN (Recombination protein N)
MLQKLVVSNYAIIDHIEVEFGGSLNIITGETGAGKSILIGALSLILGSRAESKVLFDDSRKCYVEGYFSLKGYRLQEFFQQNDLDYEETLIIRRELTTAGKSRAFVNDTPVTLEVLKELGAQLVNLHSQHETLALSSASFQLQLVDAVAHHEALLQQYGAQYALWSKTKRMLQDLLERSKQDIGDIDYLNYQLSELTEAELDVEEFEQLEQELSSLENVEEIKGNLSRSVLALSNTDGSVVDTLNELRGLLQSISKYSDQVGSLAERLDSATIELEDVSQEMERLEEGLNFDPERIAILQERQNTINRLLAKHHFASVAELVALQNDLEGRIGAFDALRGDIDKLQKQEVQLLLDLKKIGTQITASRNKVAPSIEKQVIEKLAYVGMENTQFKIAIEPLPEPGPDGADRIRFLFSANKGGKMDELRKVASGGELSRLMLVLKSLIANNMALPTLIFDEIDTGISGEVAHKAGLVMEQLAQGHQVIAITHLPQIASKGPSHLFVYKGLENDRTVTRIRTLTQSERATEIAKMLGGDKVTEAALENARELLGVERHKTL